MKLITRSEWGARAPKCRTTVNWSGSFPLIVHHTVGPQSQTVRQIQNFHMDTRGWCDIGYNYLIDWDGRIYEGRGFEVFGAHTGPGGNAYPAVSLIGTYSSVEPSDAMHQSVYDLMDSIGASFLKGHRDYMSTSCPGDAAYAKIVKGPPPESSGDPAEDYFFEAYPYDQGGVGPKILGQATGYALKTVRDLRLAAIAEANPHLTISTMRADTGRYFILGWGDLRGREWYRSRGTATEAKRDEEYDKRENHWPGMAMRKKDQGDQDCSVRRRSRPLSGAASDRSGRLNSSSIRRRK